MSRQELDALVTLVAENPTAVALMAVTGGCRKLRVPRPGGGKSGGYRVVSFYSGREVPVFLLTYSARTRRRT
jgi:hypothetical protein